MIYMGRVLSPNDILFHYEPWGIVRPAKAQNPIIHDPPVSYAPLMSLLKDDPSSFHWNRYVASGIPGFGSAASAVLSPLIAIPVLLLPLSLAYAGIVALKIVVGFMFGYGWLREERLGKRGAALGALIFTAAGPYAVWWLWQGTNATVLYPAVLWLLARILHGKRNSVTLSILLVTALLLSGFPATIAYIAYLTAAYLIYGCVRYRIFPSRELGKAVVAMIVGALISAPLIAPFISFLRRSGHLEIREHAGYDFHYPLDHLRAFLEPYYLGDPVAHFWKGDWRLAINNSFIEASVYVGILTLLFVALAIPARRARDRWFWFGVLALLLFCMFGDHNAVKDAIGKLPGFKPTPLTRLRVLMPLPVAWLAAAGFAWLTSLRIPRPAYRRFLTPQRIALVLGLIAVIDLARFAGRFYPFLEPSLTTLPDTPTLQFLRSQQQPFRVAPFFNYLWPNTAEQVRVEDIRSHFGSEEIYRELIRRFDPESWGGAVTVINFNGLRVNIADGILGFLGVRYLIEQPNIDIIHWRVIEHTEISGKPTGEFRLNAGEIMTRELFVEPQMHAIDVNFGVAKSFGRAAGVQVELVRPETGEVVYSRRWKADRLAREPKVYLPVSPYATTGNVLLLRATAHSMNALVPTTDTGFLYGKVRTPVIPFEELPDGRIFQNVAELPRHWAVWNVRQAPLNAPADFAQEALVSEAPSDSVKNLAKVTPWLRRVQMRLLEYNGSRQILETESEVPFLLSTSEKLTPELAISMDGEKADAIPINGMFAAVRVPPGQHRIELTRRIGRGWWPGFALGVILFIAVAILEARTAVSRKQTRQPAPA